MYMIEKNHMKRTVNMNSNLYVYFNVNLTLGKRELCRKYRDIAITNVKNSYQCIIRDKSCSERPKSSNVAAIRHPTVWSISICVVFSVSISGLHFAVRTHCEISMHYIQGFGYSTFEFWESHAAEYSRITLFCNGNGKAKGDLLHCMPLILKTCMCGSGRVHLSL